MSRVNLFLIGVNKAGTSWLHYRLEAHPEIFMAAEKELYYFGERHPENLENYHGRFPFEKDYRYFGDATPMYYRSEAARREIIEYTGPEARVLAIVRDPVERLRSQYYYHRQLGLVREDTSLESVLADGTSRLLEDSRYERWFPAWEDAFGDRFHLVSLERANARPQATWSELLEFLDLPYVEPPAPEDRPSNATGGSAFRTLYRWTVRPIKKHAPGVYEAMLRSEVTTWAKDRLLALLGTAEKEPLDPDLRARLEEEFAPTYAFLQERGFEKEYGMPVG